jgi:hypothetical protein
MGAEPIGRAHIPVSSDGFNGEAAGLNHDIFASLSGHQLDKAQRIIGRSLSILSVEAIFQGSAIAA